MVICQLRGWGIGFFSWVFSLDSGLVRHDAPSRLCLMDSRASECVSRRNDGGYVKGFYLEESVWF